MHVATDRSNTQSISKRILIRNLVIELVLYGLLVTIYVLAVLRWLVEPMQEMFHSNLTLYAFLGLAMMVAQAVILERLTTFLIERLGLKTFK